MKCASALQFFVADEQMNRKYYTDSCNDGACAVSNFATQRSRPR